MFLPSSNYRYSIGVVVDINVMDVLPLGVEDFDLLS